MQTNFTPKQLEDSDIQVADDILRKCVHCGFCTATCPTYVLLGDELDSPRGRIYLIKDMLENDKPASEKVALHIDRCLSCLSCMTTCPSGVHYMHLVDQARARIEQTYRRPLPDRLLRAMLAWLLPRPNLFRLSMLGARLGRPFARLAPGRLSAMLKLAPQGKLSRPIAPGTTYAAQGERRMRVALLAGCVQQVVGANINDATVNVLVRHGVEVAIPEGSGCCGALVHHMGREDEAHDYAKANIDAWLAEAERKGLDAIVINASGCGTTVKDYAFMLRDDADYADKAARISAMTKDISEILSDLGLGGAGYAPPLRIAYQAACSLQHGQKITRQPKDLLAQAGFEVLDIPEAHLCCGSAGTYNLLQPEIADELRARKVANIQSTAPQAVASGNIGCMTQIAQGTDIPVVHMVELLDWATGGRRPDAIKG